MRKKYCRHIWLPREIKFDNRFRVSAGSINVILPNRLIVVCMKCTAIKEI